MDAEPYDNSFAADRTDPAAGVRCPECPHWDFELGGCILAPAERRCRRPRSRLASLSPPVPWDLFGGTF